MGTPDERKAAKAAYMREWRLRDLERTREMERARTLSRLGPLPSERLCAWCGSTYQPVQRRRSLYCSRGCKDLAKNRARQDAINATKPPRRCLWCDVDIPPTKRADARFCSDDCNHKAHLTTRKFRRRLGEGDKRKGTPLLGLAAIAQATGWRCTLCGEPVDRLREHPDPMAPSIDHLVPLARGGTNDEANLQVVHLRCNLAKRDRPAGEQLRLV